MKILALCDSPTISSGFARVAQNLFKRWHAAGVTVDCWGICFGGWSYKAVPYINELFPAGGGGEWCAPNNLSVFLKKIQSGDYTHVWIMQDTFLLSNFAFPETLLKLCQQKGIHTTLYFPVDAPLEPKWTDIIAAVDLPVAYTRYGKAEAEAKGLVEGSRIHCEVLPHGVDTEVYLPLPYRASIRNRVKVKNDPKSEDERSFIQEGDFVMINVNANQRRKDVARSLEVLAGLRARGVPAKLIMHMPESSHEGLSLTSVGEQLGLKLGEDWVHNGCYFRGALSKLSEQTLVDFYNTADLYLTTSLGEGWGLGITEALACGLPVAIPMHTACLEISDALIGMEMGERVINLPVEKHGVYQDLDNSRRRQRVDVDAAVERIAKHYATSTADRPPLNDRVKEWLSWDRIAAEFLRLMAATPAVVKTSAPEPQVLA